MRKRLLAILLCVCISLSVITVTAFAEADYKFSPIKYYKGAQEVNVLTSGEVVAKIKVKSETKTDTLFFAMLLYKSNKLIDASVDETPDAIAQTAVTYDAKITVPSDLTDVELVTVLWKSKKEMKPICTSSIVPSSEAQLSSLKVDGIDIENFSPDQYEYTVVLSDEQIARSTAPWIGYTGFDNGLKVDVEDPVEFPGESVVTTTATDGETSLTYTIKYELPPMAGTSSVNVTRSGSAVGLMEYENITDMVSISDLEIVSASSTEANETFLKRLIPQKDLQAGKLGGIPQNVYLTHVDESFAGKIYLPAVTGSRYYNETLSLKRGATINVLCAVNSGKLTANPYNSWNVDNTGWDNIETSWNKIEDENGPYLHTDGKRYKYPPIIKDGVTDNTENFYKLVDGEKVPVKAQKSVFNPGEIIEFDTKIITNSSATTTAENRALYNNSSIDIRKQGWIYLDWRSSTSPSGGTAGGSDVRGHYPGSYTYKFYKHFNADEKPVLTRDANSGEMFVVIEFDDWQPAVNPDADLQL